MRPTLFTLPLLGPFPAYLTLLFLGFIVCLWIFVRDAAKQGLPPSRVYDLGLVALFWGMVGSRLLHVLADGHLLDYVHLCTQPKLVPAVDALVAECKSAAECGYDYLCDAATGKCYPPRDCLAVLKIWRGGFAYYGGLLLATVLGLRFAKRRDLPLAKVADLAATVIPLGLVFGRVGCFLNGCCYGKLCQVAWLGVRFPVGGLAWRAQLDAKVILPGAETLPVHATQLYEAVACLLLFLWLRFAPRWRRRPVGDGARFGWFLVGYAVLRFIIEFVRDDERGLWLGGMVSTSQLLSLPLFGIGLWLIRFGWGWGKLRRSTPPR